MKFGKLAFLISLVAFVSLAGFGCKGLSKEQTQATKAVTLEYWTVFDDVDALQKEIAAFKSSHPYITVNLRQLRAEELYPRLVEALAEDRGPDIISVQNRRLGEFASKLSPMPPNVNDVTIRYQKNTLGQVETLVNSQTKNLVSLGQLDNEYVKTVRDDVVRDGKIYGLPLSMDMMAVFYNKDLLDRSGIAQAPATWDEFQQAVKKINRYDKKTGKITQSGVAFGSAEIPGSDDLLFLLFKQSNVNFVSKEGRAVFNSNLGGAGQIMDFYSDYSNPTRDTYSWSNDQGDALDAFINGKVGFFFGYSYHFPTIRARAPQFDFRVLPMFQLSEENQSNVASYWIQAVVEKSKNKNEAWNLVDALTHSNLTKDYLDKTNRPTALRAYIGDQKNKPELAPFVSQILIAENWYRGRDYFAANRAVKDMINEWLQPVDENKINEIRQSILNRGAAKINQTF